MIVVGAGCGGLTAGALLAAQGRSVLVVEQSDSVGGCASGFERDGFRFDVAASILEVLEPLRRVFAALGTTLEDELELIPCEPSCAVTLRDGEVIRFPSSSEGIAHALAAVSEADARSWSRYEAYCAELYELLLDTLYVEPVCTLADVARLLRRRPELSRYLPAFLTSYQVVLGRFFSERAQECFAFQALTLGRPPQLLPGIYAFLPYGELRSPHYPRGGMVELPRALQRVGERHGMTVRLGAPVARVHVERRRAIGVALADGTDIRSDVVVSNVNAKTLYEKRSARTTFRRSSGAESGVTATTMRWRWSTSASTTRPRWRRTTRSWRRVGRDRCVVEGSRVPSDPANAVRDGRLADTHGCGARP